MDGSSHELDQAVKSQLRQAVSIYELDWDLIRRLQPTHIFTQSQCDVCAVSSANVEAALEVETGSDVRLVSLQPSSLETIWIDIQNVAAACGRHQAGDALVESLKARVEGIANLASSSDIHLRVAAIEWLEPLMAAGNWIPELVENASGINLVGTAGQHSPWMRWDEIVAADPDVIVAMPCGFDLARTRSEMHWLTNRPKWNDLAAVRNGNVYLCDGNQFMNRPGPRIAESQQILAEILQPNLFPPSLEKVGWERF